MTSQPDAGHFRSRFSWGLYLLPAPLHPSYPERRHRGQVHFRGAGYDLVSRQDAYRETRFSNRGSWPSHAINPSKEAHGSSCTAGLRRYGIQADGCKPPIRSHMHARTHALAHSPLLTHSFPRASRRADHAWLTCSREAPSQRTGQLARADETHTHGRRTPAKRRPGDAGNPRRRVHAWKKPDPKSSVRLPSPSAPLAGPGKPRASTARDARPQVGHVSQATNPRLRARGGPIGGVARSCARLLLAQWVEPVAVPEPARRPREWASPGAPGFPGSGGWFLTLVQEWNLQSVCSR